MGSNIDPNVKQKSKINIQKYIDKGVIANASIYDLPPDEDFWLIYILTEGDIMKHAKIYDMPLIWVYSYADMKIGMSEKARQK